ncbi:MAG TPA: hypothetical protein VK816_00405, partial [Jatrophihabitantaceae bacterium]|nr:hypothetical protein [Jatrophihabitantaceae bacterium]
TTWSQLQPSQSPQFSKQGAGLAFAPAVSASVLFGTQYGIGYPAADASAWTHGANTWTQYPPGASDPKPRSFPGLATDQQGGVLLFGGAASDGTALGDTWEWAGAWSVKTVAISPPARSMPLMAFDSACKLVVLYGGELQTQQTLTNFSDSWIWDGQAWTKVG